MLSSRKISTQIAGGRLQRRSVRTYLPDLFSPLARIIIYFLRALRVKSWHNHLLHSSRLHKAPVTVLV